MNITAELPLWLFLVLCCCYSTGSLFVYFIMSAAFGKIGDIKFLLIYLGSVMWPIGLVFYIVYGLSHIVNDIVESCYEDGDETYNEYECK